MPNPLAITGTGTTVRGFPGSMSSLDFALWDYARGRVNGEQGVLTGFQVAPGGGTRDLSVSGPAEAILPGLRVTTTAAQVVGPAAAGTTGSNRMDLLVLEADWLANTQAGEARLRIVTGNNAKNPPNPTQTLTTGVYQMPIAQALLRGAAASYAATDIERVAPLPRWDRRYTPAIRLRTVRGVTNWVTLATADIIDPGWPYRLDCRGQMRFEGEANSTAVGVIRAYDVTAGAELTQGRSSMLDSGVAGRHLAQFSDQAALTSGSRTVTFDIGQDGASETAVLTAIESSSNYFTIIQRPAL